MQSGQKNTAKLLTLEQRAVATEREVRLFSVGPCERSAAFIFSSRSFHFLRVPVFVQFIKPRQTLFSTAWTLRSDQALTFRIARNRRPDLTFPSRMRSNPIGWQLVSAISLLPCSTSSAGFFSRT